MTLSLFDAFSYHSVLSSPPSTLIYHRESVSSILTQRDQDKARFLERLGQTILKGKCTVYAWVVMNNHVHIFFKSGKDGISAIMRKLLTWYAVYFNRRHRRTGHLFENRYKSILCDEESYLLALVS